MASERITIRAIESRELQQRDGEDIFYVRFELSDAPTPRWADLFHIVATDRKESFQKYQFELWRKPADRGGQDIWYPALFAYCPADTEGMRAALAECKAVVAATNERRRDEIAQESSSYKQMERERRQRELREEEFERRFDAIAFQSGIPTKAKPKLKKAKPASSGCLPLILLAGTLGTAALLAVLA